MVLLGCWVRSGFRAEQGCAHRLPAVPPPWRQGSTVYETINGTIATARLSGAQSTETVPTPAACSLRATERAVSSGMSRGFCTGRPRRPM